MSKQKAEGKFTILVSDSFEQTDEKCNCEVPFRRWLVREIEEQRMTVSEAVKQFRSLAQGMQHSHNRADFPYRRDMWCL